MELVLPLILVFVILVTQEVLVRFQFATVFQQTIQMCAQAMVHV